MNERPAGAFSPAAALGRRRWLALAVTLGVLAVVAAWLLGARRYYTATATLTATPSPSLLSSTGNFDNLETTLAEIANSQAVLRDVAAVLPQRRSIARLRDEVTAVRVTGTVLIRITVKDPDPAAAAAIANATLQALPRHDPSNGMLKFATTDRARVPTTFSSPNAKVVMLAGVPLAILLGIGAALLFERLAGTVDTARQLAEVTGTDVVPTLIGPREMGPPAIAAEPPASAGFRPLRIALESAAQSEPLGPVVVTSLPADRALTEWVVWNLAEALARVRHHVLIVDCDFDRPDAADGTFGHTSPGLYALLAEECGIDDALCVTEPDGVTVLPAGVATSSPDVLVELRLPKVLAEVGDRFDVVLLLASGSSLSGDSPVTAAAGSLLVAVTAGQVRLASARAMVEQSRAAEKLPLRAVLVRRER